MDIRIAVRAGWGPRRCRCGAPRPLQSPARPPLSCSCSRPPLSCSCSQPPPPWPGCGSGAPGGPLPARWGPGGGTRAARSGGLRRAHKPFPSLLPAPPAGQVPAGPEDRVGQLWRHLHRCDSAMRFGGAMPDLTRTDRCSWAPSASLDPAHCLRCLPPCPAGTHLLTGEEVGIKLVRLGEFRGCFLSCCGMVCGTTAWILKRFHRPRASTPCCLRASVRAGVHQDQAPAAAV